PAFMPAASCHHPNETPVRRTPLKIGTTTATERSGLSFRGLIYIEHGRRNPGVLTILDIAKGLEVQPGDILNPVVEEGAQKPTAQ
ncbi:helix-turn-helix domain-containing protein, partial [Streptomyces mirabilis]|uniref:helix-turn-helix domain-containing protein n=1 Tax=Streptomyces mirabilis TaxID=68239 RepID=UPI0036DBC564